MYFTRQDVATAEHADAAVHLRSFDVDYRLGRTQMVTAREAGRWGEAIQGVLTEWMVFNPLGLSKALEWAKPQIDAYLIAANIKEDARETERLSILRGATTDALMSVVYVQFLSDVMDLLAAGALSSQREDKTGLWIGDEKTWKQRDYVTVPREGEAVNTVRLHGHHDTTMRFVFNIAAQSAINLFVSNERYGSIAQPSHPYHRIWQYDIELYNRQGSRAAPHDDVERKLCDIVSQHLTSALVFLEIIKPHAKHVSWQTPSVENYQRSALVALNWSASRLATNPLARFHKLTAHPVGPNAGGVDGRTFSADFRDLGDANYLALLKAVTPVSRWTCAGRHALDFPRPLDGVVSRTRKLRAAANAGQTTYTDLISGIEAITTGLALAAGPLLWGTEKNDHHSLADNPAVRDEAEKTFDALTLAGGISPPHLSFEPAPA